MVLLKSTPGSSTVVLPRLDAHYAVVFENDRVRVSRGRFGRHEKTEMVKFAPHVWVALTDQRRRIQRLDGSGSDDIKSVGFVGWSSGGTFSNENLDDLPRETVMIEPKNRQ